MGRSRSIGTAIAAGGMMMAGSVLVAAWKLADTGRNDWPAPLGVLLLVLGLVFAFKAASMDDKND